MQINIDIVEPENNCPICLEDLKLKFDSNNKQIESHSPYYLTESNSIVPISGNVFTLCGHVFHILCLLKLDEEKCPLCRYLISPANITSCALCVAEIDLWMCLICGSINCGYEESSSNHRDEHFVNTKHIYYKQLGNCSSNVIFDFSKNNSLNNYIHNEILKNALAEVGVPFNEITTNTNDDINSVSTPQNVTNINTSHGHKLGNTPYEKISEIIGEYNSIITSQLESQRIYYLNLIKQVDASYSVEMLKYENELVKQKNELEEITGKQNELNEVKKSLFNEILTNETKLKLLNSEKSSVDLEYQALLVQKNNTDNRSLYLEQTIKDELDCLDEEMSDIIDQMKEIRVHINTSKAMKNELIGSNIMGIFDVGEKKSGKYKKPNKKK